MNPAQVHEAILEKALILVRTAMMEAGSYMPENVLMELVRPCMRVTITAASEWYAQYPEHLAFAGLPHCVVCTAEVERWEVTGAMDGAVKYARPCGHLQPAI